MLDKKISKFILIVSTVLFLSSCEICTQCIFTDMDGTIIDENDSFCGSSEDVANMEEQQQVLADSLNLNVSCIRE